MIAIARRSNGSCINFSALVGVFPRVLITWSNGVTAYRGTEGREIPSAAGISVVKNHDGVFISIFISIRLKQGNCIRVSRSSRSG